MNTDNELLAEYARQGGEPAFRELVRRHINMVHAAALREAGGNVPLAEDITQEVFAELARRAAKLCSHPALAGWLYTCVRQMAANARRSEHRRQRREQEAFTMNELLEPNDSEQLWRQVRPVLDDAMHELNDEDRTAVVMRFFEGLSLKEVGTALGLSENAARMRVERSLGKLHGLLSRRGINSTAATLAAVLVAGTVLSTSSSFASSVAAGAMSTAGSGSFSVAKFVTMAKSKIAIAGTFAILATAAILWHNLRANSGGKTGLMQPSAAATISPVVNDMPQSNIVVPTAASATTVASSSRMFFHLVDADANLPLSGAKLYMFYLFEDGRGKVVKAKTDGKGELEVDIPKPPYRGLNLFVTAAGHVPKVTSWGFGRSMPSEYTMKLERGVSIGGQVVDEKGQPVAGAKIQIDNPGNDPTLAENIQFGPDAAVKTDANGQWTSDMIPRQFEQVSLLVTDKEHAETNVTVRPGTPDANKLVITMPNGFAIKGIVQDSHGNPIEGATVRQVRLNEENEHTETSDSSGAFNFKAMPAGELMLAVQAEGFAPGVQTIEVQSPMDSLKFQLGPGEILRGRVVDEQGNPVTNAFVETTRRGENKIRWSTNTDADGRFQWNSAPEEPLLYSVLAEGFNQAYAQTLEANGSEQVIRLTRHADVDNIQIRGTVADADTGQPLNTFKVFVGERDPEWAFPLMFYTDGQDGKFALSLPSKSTHPGYVVQIEQPGYLPAVSASYQKSNGNQTLEFKLRKGTGPSGVVLLPSGEPAVNSAVLLCTPLAGVTLNSGAQIQKGLNTTTYRTQTDQTGKFSLPPAVDPEGVIVIHDQGIAQVSFSELAGNSNITLQSWATVKGKLVLESKPVANQEIALFNQDMHYSKAGVGFPFLTFSLKTTTDTNGGFVFDKVPPGPCRVFQRVNGFASYETSITANAGGVTDVVLGGAGRSVVGKAILTSATESPDWRRVVVRLQSKTGNLPASRPKSSDFSTPESYVAAMKSFVQEHADQKDFVAACDSDGSFQLADVPAGNYELKIELRDARLNSTVPHDISDPSPVVSSVVRDVIVPDDQSTQPIKLGTLELLPQQSSVSYR